MKIIAPEIFKKEFQEKTNYELARKYECSESVIRIVAAALGYHRGAGGWTKKDESTVIKKYGTITNQELAEELGRTKNSVINKYRELKGLTKKKTISKIVSKK